MYESKAGLFAMIPPSISNSFYAYPLRICWGSKNPGAALEDPVASEVLTSNISGF